MTHPWTQAGIAVRFKPVDPEARHRDDPRPVPVEFRHPRDSRRVMAATDLDLIRALLEAIREEMAA